tara:strand:- start:71 stop:487 length:417 start_codon:yes stop_codon:yes gene_type:complete
MEEKMELNKVTLKEIRTQIQSKLNELDLGLKLELGNCSYDTDNATFKLNVQVEGGKSKAEQDLEMIAPIRCLDLTKIWNEGTHKFRLHGFNNRARKNPFVIIDILTQKQYVISDKVAERQFSKEMSNVIQMKKEENNG